MCPTSQKKASCSKTSRRCRAHPICSAASIDLFLERCRGKNVDKIVGIDARGFLFGSAVAYELGLGFIPIRRRGKLPYRTDTAKYSPEDGEAEMEMHIDAVEKASAVVLVDDLLATGGTSAAAAALIRNAGADLIEAQFLIELEFLEGRKRLEPTPVTAFLKDPSVTFTVPAESGSSKPVRIADDSAPYREQFWLLELAVSNCFEHKAMRASRELGKLRPCSKPPRAHRHAASHRSPPAIQKISEG